MSEARAPARPSHVPAITTARELAKSHGLKKLILLCQLPDGRFGYTSYGWSKAECDRAKAAGDKLFPVFEEALMGEPQ